MIPQFPLRKIQPQMLQRRERDVILAIDESVPEEECLPRTRPVLVEFIVVEIAKRSILEYKTHVPHERETALWLRDE